MGNSPLHQFHTRGRKYNLLLMCLFFISRLPCFWRWTYDEVCNSFGSRSTGLDPVCDCCLCCPLLGVRCVCSACTWFHSIGVFVCQQTTIRGVCVCVFSWPFFDTESHYIWIDVGACFFDTLFRLLFNKVTMTMQLSYLKSRRCAWILKHVLGMREVARYISQKKQRKGHINTYKSIRMSASGGGPSRRSLPWPPRAEAGRPSCRRRALPAPTEALPSELPQDHNKLVNKLQTWARKKQQHHSLVPFISAF